MGAVGKHIPDPGFSGDAGGADESLAAALAGHTAGGGEHAVLAALVTARVLVPVVAVLVEEAVAHPRTLHQEKATEMALVTLVGRDGRRALPVFTSLAALTAWRPDARPVPVKASLAARSAVAEGASVLVVDVAGPHRFEVTGAALDALAQGRAWLPPHTDPEVRAVVAGVVAAAQVFADVRFGAGENGSVRVTLAHVPDADLVAVTAAARVVATRLAADDLIRDRARAGLDLVVVRAQKTSGQNRGVKPPILSQSWSDDGRLRP